MDHLAERGINCPRPIHGRDGKALRHAGRQARRHHELPAGHVAAPHDRRSIAAQVGEALAGCIWPAATSPLKRPNALSVAGWRPLFEGSRRHIDAAARARAGGRARFLRGQLAEGAAVRRHPCRPVQRQCLLPARQAVGADRLLLRLQRFLAYDVAICLNAWCFEPDNAFNATKARARCCRATTRCGRSATTSARRCRCWRAARRCASC